MKIWAGNTSCNVCTCVHNLCAIACAYDLCVTVNLFSSSLPRDNFVSVDEESLSLLLHFSLATGDVNSILDCLQILLGQPTCLLAILNHKA